MKRLPSNYFPTPRLLKAAFWRAYSDIKREPWKLAVAAIAGTAACFMFDTSAAIVWAVFLLFLLYSWDGRIIDAFAVAGIVASIALFAFGSRKQLEPVAVYTYLVFAMAMALRSIDYARRIQLLSPKRRA